MELDGGADGGGEGGDGNASGCGGLLVRNAHFTGRLAVPGIQEAGAILLLPDIPCIYGGKVWEEGG